MKRILIFAVRIMDLPFALITAPGAILMLLFRKVGSARMPTTRDIYKSIGVFPIQDHYYEPLFQTKHLNRSLSEPRVLPGVNLHESEQVDLLDRMEYAAEPRDMKLDADDALDLAFRLNNGSFESGDAEFLYQFIRLLKPRRVIEIGSGNSTRIAFQALQANLSKDGVRLRAHVH